MADHDNETISEAIVTWTGHGEHVWPHRDDLRVRDRFGAASAPTLLAIVKRLENEYYESDAHISVQGQQEMSKAARARFRRLHPEISDQAVDAFAWCSSFDNR